MKKRKILIVGYYGYDNLGDDLMLLALLNGINDSLENLKITILARKSQNLANLIDKFENVEIAYFKMNNKPFNLYLYVKTIFTVDLTIWGGGTCFSDQDGLGNFKFFIFNLIFRRKFSYLGIGIGELKKNTSKLITRLLLNNSLFTSFRDPKSLTIANSLTPMKDHFTLSSDLTYILDFKLFKQSSTSDRYILISLRDLTNFYTLDQIKNRQEVLLKFLFGIKQIHECDIVVMPIDSVKDFEANNRFYHKLMNGVTSKNVIFVDDNDMEKKLSVILNSDLNITERLHSVVISAFNNVNCIPLSYSPKINSFCEEVNILNFISYDEELTVSRLQQCLNTSESNESVDIPKLKQLKERSKYNIELLQKFYES